MMRETRHGSGRGWYLVDKQVVWLTGAGSGIGQAVAIELARAGAAVIISGRRRAPLEQVAQEISSFSGSVRVKPVDVRNSEQVDTAAAEIVQEFGRIDIVVNAAGTNIPNRSWAQLSQADWMDVNATNTNGAFFCTRAVLGFMREQKQGLIVNIGSWGGRFALKLTGVAYAGSKRALIALTETLNMEEGENGIRACVILPAAVNTPFLRRRSEPVPQETLAKMLQPSDIARVVRFVAESPPHVCLNEILLSPTLNYVYAHSA
jgi:NADP-dependent 3-hydroxy acid dehydrogenase YdfG